MKKAEGLLKEANQKKVDVNREAQQIKEKAEQEADALLAAARRELEVLERRQEDIKGRSPVSRPCWRRWRVSRRLPEVAARRAAAAPRRRPEPGVPVRAASQTPAKPLKRLDILPIKRSSAR